MSLIQMADLNGADILYYLEYLMEEISKYLYEDPDVKPEYSGPF